MTRYYEDLRTGATENLRFIWSVPGLMPTILFWSRENWKKLSIICMVELERQFDEKTEKETSYYLSSIANDAKKFRNAVRNYWGIENSLHWVLDV